MWIAVLAVALEELETVASNIANRCWNIVWSLSETFKLFLGHLHFINKVRFEEGLSQLRSLGLCQHEPSRDENFPICSRKHKSPIFIIKHSKTH